MIELQIGFSTASFFAKSYPEDALTAICDMGAKQCEVFLNTFSEYEDNYITLLSGRAKELGLNVYSIHPMGTQFEPQLFSPYSRQRDDAWALYESVLAAAKRLNAGVYVMHGPVYMKNGMKNLELTRIGPIIRDLSALAKSYKVRLAWENVSWCLFSTPEFAPRVLDAAKTDDLWFTLDIKQAVRSGFDPSLYFKAVGTKLANVHLCGYHVEADGGLTLCLPSNGQEDIAQIKQACKNAGYTGPAFIEVYSDLYADPAELERCFKRVCALSR